MYQHEICHCPTIPQSADTFSNLEKHTNVARQLTATVSEKWKTNMPPRLLRPCHSCPRCCRSSHNRHHPRPPTLLHRLGRLERLERRHTRSMLIDSLSWRSASQESSRKRHLFWSKSFLMAKRTLLWQRLTERERTEGHAAKVWINLGVSSLDEATKLRQLVLKMLGASLMATSYSVKLCTHQTPACSSSCASSVRQLQGFYVARSNLPQLQQQFHPRLSTTVMMEKWRAMLHADKKRMIEDHFRFRVQDDVEYAKEAVHEPTALPLFLLDEDTDLLHLKPSAVIVVAQHDKKRKRRRIAEDHKNVIDDDKDAKDAKQAEAEKVKEKLAEELRDVLWKKLCRTCCSTLRSPCTTRFRWSLEIIGCSAGGPRRRRKPIDCICGRERLRAR